MGNAVKLVLVPIVALGCAVGLAGPAMAAKAASQVEITNCLLYTSPSPRD